MGGSYINDGRSHPSATVGGRAAILPTLRRRVETDGACGPNAVSTRTLHVGLAGSADYDFTVHRALYMVGPTLESYLQGECFD